MINNPLSTIIDIPPPIMDDLLVVFGPDVTIENVVEWLLHREMKRIEQNQEMITPFKRG